MAARKQLNAALLVSPPWEATAWKTDAGKLVGYRTTRGDGAGIEVARDGAFIISRFGNNDNGRWNEAGALEAATFSAKQLNVRRS